jgi:hypothetical protein
MPTTSSKDQYVGGNVEPTAQVKQEAPHSQLLGVTNLISAAVVTVMVFVAIVGRWGKLGWLDKGMAVTLLLSLAAMPIMEIARKETLAKRLESIGASKMYVGYIWVMLATLLFKVI